MVHMSLDPIPACTGRQADIFGQKLVLKTELKKPLRLVVVYSTSNQVAFDLVDVTSRHEKELKVITGMT